MSVGQDGEIDHIPAIQGEMAYVFAVKVVDYDLLALGVEDVDEALALDYVKGGQTDVLAGAASFVLYGCEHIALIIKDIEDIR